MPNKFIKHSAIFCLCFVMYSAINLMINKVFIKSVSPINETNILILGDSHIETALNPNGLPNATNIAQSAEPYVVSLWKLEKILSYYTPDTVILGFSAHNLSDFNDLKFSHSIWSKEIAERTYGIFDLTDVSDKIEIDYQMLFRMSFKHLCIFPKKKHLTYIGNFTRHTEHNLSNANAIERHFFFEGKPCNLSVLSINSLNSIKELCRKKGIQLILISTPVHESYRKGIPEKFKDELHKISTRYSSEGVYILDYSTLELHDSCYLNINHINTFGSDILMENLRSNLYH